MIVAAIAVVVLAYLALGSFLGASLRRAREQQTGPSPQIEAVRDRRADIARALRGRQ